MTSKSNVVEDSANSDPIDLLWPEWDDAECNSIRWELYAPSKIPNPDNLYKAEIPFLLPASLQCLVKSYERTYTLFEGVPINLYSEFTQPPDYIALNEHIFHSDLLRSIISTFSMLQRIGDETPFQTEHETSKFQSNTNYVPWRPWFHIYSCNKAGKNGSPRPAWNMAGFCLCRVYYAGFWRMIKVDDLIPLDAKRRPLLPLIKSADGTISLWPALLTKAMMMAAGQSWSLWNEIVDFSAMQVLSGWICQTIHTKGFAKADLWDLCKPYVEFYSWPDDVPKTPPTAKKMGKKSSQNQSPRKGKVATFKKSQAKRMFYAVVVLSDMKHGIENLTPCKRHLVYLRQLRNIPLEKPVDIPELARWKEFRWVEWARKHGEWPYSPRGLKHSFFLLNSWYYQARAANEDKKKEASLGQVAPETIKLIEKPSVRSAISAKSSKSRSRSRSAKSKTRSKTPKVEIVKNYDFWLNFDECYPHVEELKIFFVPSAYPFHLTITNIKSSVKKAAEGHPVNQPDRVYWPTTKGTCHNQPLYLFMDALHPKFVIFFLQHKNVRLQNATFRDEEVEIYGEEGSTAPALGTPKLFNEDDYNVYRSRASVLIEEMMVEQKGMGPIKYYLISMGTRAQTVSFPEGRSVMKLWIRSDAPYSLEICSDTEVRLGSFHAIAELMNTESLQMQGFVQTVSLKFQSYYETLGYVAFHEAMHEFYRAVKPDLEDDKKVNKLIYEKLEWEILNIISKSKKDSYEQFLPQKCALQVLFLKSFVNKRTYDPHLRSMEPHELYYEKAAVTIQAFFKRVYINLLKAHRVPSDKLYKKNLENFRKIYENFFSPLLRMIVVPFLFRSVIKAAGIDQLERYYKISNDLDLTLTTYSFNSSTITESKTIEPNQWVPVVLCVFYVIIPEPVFCRVDLQCPLPRYVLRVFNNDDEREMPRVTDNVTPNYYAPNKLGYTIFAYGRTVDTVVTNFSWNLLISHKRTYVPAPLRCTFSEMEKRTLLDNYIPNASNIVSRTTISVIRSCVAAIRFTTTYPHVKLQVRVLDEQNGIISETTGQNYVIVSPIYMRNEYETDPSIDADSGGSQSPIKLTKRASRASGKDSVSITKKKTLRRKQDASGKSESSVLSKGSQGRTSHPKRQFFTIEVVVVEDSWPLTKREWENVQEQKRKKLYFPVPDGKNAAYKKKFNDWNKFIKTADKKIMPPNWTLLVMCTDDIRVHKDQKREQEILEMKLQWEENKPGRIQEGFITRNHYLESHYIQLEHDSSAGDISSHHSKKVMSKTEARPSSKSLVKTSRPSSHRSNAVFRESESGERSLTPFVPEDMQLPHLDLSNYEQLLPIYTDVKRYILDQLKDIVESTEPEWIKTHSAIDLYESRLKEAVVRFNRHQERYLEHSKDFLIDHEQRFRDVYQKFLADRVKSKHLMDEAYDVRKICMQEHRDEMRQKGLDSRSSKSSKKSRPGSAKSETSGKSKSRSKSKK